MKPFNFTQYIKNNPLLKESPPDADTAQAQAQQIISKIEQGLESQSITKDDMDINNVTQDSAEIDISLGDLGVTVIVELDVIDYPTSPETEGPYTFFGGSEGQVAVKPKEIRVYYAKGEEYTAKDTSRIVDLLNDKYKDSVIKRINRQWNNL